MTRADVQDRRVADLDRRAEELRAQGHEIVRQAFAAANHPIQARVRARARRR